MSLYSAEEKKLINFFIKFSGYLVPPYVDNTNLTGISKTMFFYLLGKQQFHFIYNLEKSLYPMRTALELLLNTVKERGDILIISDSAPLKGFFKYDPYIKCTGWKRVELSNSKNYDLILLVDTVEESLVEVHRKISLIVGVGATTTSRMSYPFNLNIEKPVLAAWFYQAITTSCLRGYELRKKTNELES
uniref:Ribosomal protein S2 n=1 Tax=Phaeophyceae sp. TaxID=2249243 RepID=A0A8E8PDM2_9PHAE|nr:ribosomal protein S2 [Phaeophyceae sp.]